MEEGAPPGVAPPWQALSRHAQAARVPLFSVTDPQPFYKQVILVTKDAERAGRKVRERPECWGKHITPGRAFLGRRVWPRRASRGPTGRFGSAECFAGPGRREGGARAPSVRPGSGLRREALSRVAQDSGGGGDVLGAVHGIRFKGKRLPVLPCCTGEPETHVLVYFQFSFFSERLCVASHVSCAQRCPSSAVDTTGRSPPEAEHPSFSVDPLHRPPVRHPTGSPRVATTLFSVSTLFGLLLIYGLCSLSSWQILSQGASPKGMLYGSERWLLCNEHAFRVF